MRKTAILVLAGALALGACDSGSKPADETATATPVGGNAQAAVEAIEKSWWSGSAEEAMKFYADDAVMFSTGEPESTDDRNKITQDMGSFFAMNPTDFTVENKRLQELDDDTAVSSGIVRFTADVGEGRNVLSARFTQVLQRQEDGNWKIVHEHMSIPPGGTL